MQRTSFEVFKGNICHRVKDDGELDFIMEVLRSDVIAELFEQKWYPEALYVLAMADYLSRKNGIPLCGNYNKFRACKLDSILYPAETVMLSKLYNDETILSKCFDESIPEFKRFNIAECNVEDIA